MQTTQTITGVREAIRIARQAGQSIGCVPTMGALHEGHLSLIRAAREQSDFVVATIFVNPTQFAPNEDFSQYPRPLKRDLDLCKQSGADLVFHPEPEEMYGSHNDVTVHVGDLATRWEGAAVRTTLMAWPRWSPSCSTLCSRIKRSSAPKIINSSASSKRCAET